ncbi:PrsW family intramembrane metalloprotease [Patescibacteria group bacterium]
MEQSAAIGICVLLAFLPVIMWGYIFLKKHPEAKKLVIITFIAGMVSVAPLLAYKYLWQFFPWINAFIWTRNLNADILGLSSFMLIPLPILVTFMFVGVIEEVSKIISVRVVDNKAIRSIDDAIELCIVAALGFAFIENIIYFNNIAAVRGMDQLFFPFIFRSLFSTFAHVMFSGIFGYFYGVAHFAEPILKEELRNKRHPIMKLFHKIFHIRRPVLFHHEKIVEGFVIASLLHAFFNIFLEMEWAFMIIPFLAGGYATLVYLLKKKENLKKYGKLASIRTSD